MSHFKIINSLLVASFLSFSGVARAEVYDFGRLLTASSGYAAPDSFASDPFAQLEATDNGGGIWTFLLSVNSNLFSSFGNNAFLQSITFDFNPDPVQPVSSFISSNVAGVSFVSSTKGSGNGGLLSDIDFGTSFGSGYKQRLDQNDWVSWSVSGLYSGSRLANMYVNVKNFDTGYIAKYTPLQPMSAVPEPETYAMLLAGLGLIGFSARRRA